jgi:hypothetical protein
MPAPLGNKYALGNRSNLGIRAYTAKFILETADKYFKKCFKKKIPITITGLGLAIGTTRKTMIEYAKRDEECGNAMKRVVGIVEDFYEARLSGNSPTGSIFWLKNHGWSDKQEIEHSGSISLKELSRVSKEK